MSARSTLRLDCQIRDAWNSGHSTILTANTNDAVVAEDGAPRMLRHHIAWLAGEQGRATVLCLQSTGVSQLPLPGRPPVSLRLPDPNRSVAEIVEAVLGEARRATTPLLIMLDYVDLMMPNLAGQVSPDQNRTLELIAEFVIDPVTIRQGHRLALLAKTGPLDERLTRLPGFTILEVELPDLEERRALIERALHPDQGEGLRLAAGVTAEDLANLSGGLQLNDLIKARNRSANGMAIGRDWIQTQKVEALRRTAGEGLTVYPPGSGLSDVAGLPQLRRIVKEALESGRAPRRLLLCGPPGVGKTLCVTAVADELGLGATALGTVRSMWLGESERTLHRVIGALTALAPVVLHIDEIDQAIGQRQTGQSADGGTSERMMADLMTFLGSNPEKRITVIATSNRPDLLDPAMFDRFTIVPVLHPTPVEAAQILAIAARKEHRHLDQASAEDIVRRHHGLLTGRVLVDVLDRAMTFADADGQTTTIHAEHLAAAFDDLLMAVEPIEHERLALLAISMTTFTSYLPWQAARYLGQKPELPPYLPPLLDENGRIDPPRLRARLQELGA